MAQQNGVHDEDVWGEGDSGDERQLDREWQARRQEHYTSGYREGVEAGKQETVQEGFNAGYSAGAAAGYEWGVARGAAATLHALLARGALPSGGTPPTYGEAAQLHAALSTIPFQQASGAVCRSLMEEQQRAQQQQQQQQQEQGGGAAAGPGPQSSNPAAAAVQQATQQAAALVRQLGYTLQLQHSSHPPPG